MWFAVLKDSDFGFDTENPSRGGYYDPNTKEAIVNLAHESYKDMTEDEIINKIIEYAGHESGHKAFHLAVSDYLKEHLKELDALFTNSFLFYVQRVFSIHLKQNMVLKPGITDNQLTELKALVETIMERRLLDEVFAGLSGRDGSISRVLMERYHLKLADEIKNTLLTMLTVMIKIWKDRFKKIEPMQDALDEVEEMMLLFIDSLREFAYHKGSERLLNAVVKQIKERDASETDSYEKLIRLLVASDKSDILLEYIKTGDFDVLRPFIRERWEEL